MPTKLQEARINGWIARLKPRMLLDNWAVIVTYKDKDEPSRTDGLRTLADMTVHSRYNEGRMNIYPTFFKEPIGNQRATVTHELIHIATDPAREALEQAVKKGVLSDSRKDDIIEQLTEHWAKTLTRAYVRKCKSTDKYLL